MDTSVSAAVTAASMPDRPAGGERPVRPGPPCDDFVIDGWLVQPTLGRLSRGVATLRLRRQLMDVLVCLARGNGRTVGRQELLDAAWGGRLVGKTAIARSIVELRLALGDDARQPRLIETIRQRGYRIIAPVAWNARALEPEAAAAAGPRRSPDARFSSGYWPLIALLVVTAAVTLLLLVRSAA